MSELKSEDPRYSLWKHLMCLFTAKHFNMVVPKGRRCPYCGIKPW